MTEHEQKLEAVLQKFMQPIKGIPLEVIIKALYGHTVIRFDAEWNEGALLEAIAACLLSASKAINKNPIVRPRPNEVGNDIEPFVVNALLEGGFSAAPPKTTTGAGKSTGYPDILVDLEPVPIYIEVKSFALKNHDTTQRSFYLSPADDPKVTKDAHHLIAGFQMKRSGNEFTVEAFEIVDLWGLDCDMKAEFNSDNKRMYSARQLLLRREVG